MRKQVGLQGEKAQAIKELSSFFNAVRQAVFHFKPNGFDSRKAKRHCFLITGSKRSNKQYANYKSYKKLFHIFFKINFHCKLQLSPGAIEE